MLASMFLFLLSKPEFHSQSVSGYPHLCIKDYFLSKVEAKIFFFLLPHCWNCLGVFDLDVLIINALSMYLTLKQLIL
jgi:hypothetical protein